MYGEQRNKGSMLALLARRRTNKCFQSSHKKGLNPDMRTLPSDYNEWLKANGLDPVEWDTEEEYDD